jgi:hypothetical protein
VLHLPELAVATAVLSFGTASARLLVELLSFLKNFTNVALRFKCHIGPAPRTVASFSAPSGLSASIQASP